MSLSWSREEQTGRLRGHKQSGVRQDLPHANSSICPAAVSHQAAGGPEHRTNVQSRGQNLRTQLTAEDHNYKRPQCGAQEQLQNQPQTTEGGKKQNVVTSLLRCPPPERKGKH